MSNIKRVLCWHNFRSIFLPYLHLSAKSLYISPVINFSSLQWKRLKTFPNVTSFLLHPAVDSAKFYVNENKSTSQFFCEKVKFNKDHNWFGKVLNNINLKNSGAIAIPWFSTWQEFWRRTVFSRIVSAEPILFWIWKLQKTQTVAENLNFLGNKLIFSTPNTNSKSSFYW